MPPVTLSDGMLVIVNIAAWAILHIVPAWLGMRVPPGRFDHRARLYRERRFERGGRLYERLFAIRRWKGLLPDGARLFTGGFAKKNLAPGDDPAAYYTRFVQETCRGELVHWIVLGCAALFFLWNPPWAGWIMVGYALLVNLPCILAQRYNRIRLVRLLHRARAAEAAR